jgi:hypothetical protein
MSMFAIARAIISLVIFGCTVHYFYLFFARPGNLDKFLGNRLSPRQRPIKIYAYIIAVCVGIGFCFYEVIYRLLYIVVPHGWMNGEQRGGLAFLIAIFGTGVVVTGTEKIARRLAAIGDDNSK